VSRSAFTNAMPFSAFVAMLVVACAGLLAARILRAGAIAAPPSAR
jgi:hypothetical protein